MKLGEGFYTICLLPDKCSRKQFISEEKDKNEQMKLISLSVKAQKIYVELLSV
jgi:hypothetical protein